MPLALLADAPANELLRLESYARPASSIESAALAPWWRNVTPGALSPDGKWALVTDREGPPPLARLARPWDNLGGLQVELEAIRERGYFVRAAGGYRVMDLATGKLVSLPQPAGARVQAASWSPDSRRIAYAVLLDDRTELWTAGVDGKGGRATDRPLQPVRITSLAWTKGGEIAAPFRPEGVRGLPERPDVSETPRVLRTDPGKNKLYVYASLLRGPVDVARLRTALTVQLGLVRPGGPFTAVGQPGPYVSVDPSPDGRFVRASVWDGSTSYVVPSGNFGSRQLVLDRAGKELVELEKSPLRDGDDEDAKPKDDARRGLDWRPDGAGLTFFQAGPKPKEGEKRKDQLVLWRAPFGEKDREVIYEQEARMDRAVWTADGQRYLLWDKDGAQTRLRLGEGATLKPFLSYKPDDAEKVGSPVMLPDGTLRLLAGDAMLFRGTTLSDDPLKSPPRPWLDRVEPGGGRERLFESPADSLETAEPTDPEGKVLLVTRQSAKEVPNSFRLDRESKTRVPLTRNQDFSPDLTAEAKREWIQVTRNDGFKFWVKVTTPRFGAYRAPAFFWFYPSEVKDQAAYDKGRRSLNVNVFSAVGGTNKSILLRAGYVLVEPDCPIVAGAGQSNDSYVPQLRNNLAATIDALARRDLIDRERLALGGHSYGAFSTVNAMIHTPFFKAGIAGAGNYNRTLTPFGFQAESRPLWTGREVYLSMSPILYAEQLTGALLMYHGAEDQNVGTSPINSDRLFAALESLGKTAALYVYPYEDHGQIARETILDQWARWVAWLDEYVKGKEKG